MPICTIRARGAVPCSTRTVMRQSGCFAVAYRRKQVETRDQAAHQCLLRIPRLRLVTPRNTFAVGKDCAKQAVHLGPLVLL